MIIERKYYQVLKERKMKKYLKFIQRYLKNTFENDKQNTILEAYADFSKNYEYLDLEEKERKDYFKYEVLRDEAFLNYVYENYLDQELNNATMDEIVYNQYIQGLATYDEYLAVCEQEECEPLNDIKIEIKITPEKLSNIFYGNNAYEDENDNFIHDDLKYKIEELKKVYDLLSEGNYKKLKNFDYYLLGDVINLLESINLKIKR